MTMPNLVSKRIIYVYLFEEIFSEEQCNIFKHRFANESMHKHYKLVNTSLILDSNEHDAAEKWLLIGGINKNNNTFKCINLIRHFGKGELLRLANTNTSAHFKLAKNVMTATRMAIKIPTNKNNRTTLHQLKHIIQSIKRKEGNNKR